MTLINKNSNWTILLIASVMLAFVFAAVMCWFWDKDKENPFTRGATGDHNFQLKASEILVAHPSGAWTSGESFVVGKWWDTGVPVDELEGAPAWDSPIWKALHSDLTPKVEWEAWRRIEHPGAASTWGHRWVPAGEKLPPASEVEIEYADGRKERVKP